MIFTITNMIVNQMTKNINNKKIKQKMQNAIKTNQTLMMNKMNKKVKNK
jgi:hypothetical protein